MDIEKLTNGINKEDYEEPRCPFCKPNEVKSIPIMRVIEKLDEYLNAKDYDAAKRHLEYWVQEAETVKDLRGKLSVLNEQIGLYRKTGKKDAAFAAIEDALKLAEESGFEGTITMGTTLVNAATGYKAFGENEKALKLYEKAQPVYEEYLKQDDSRLGGLYNNMALALCESGDFERSEEMFQKALGIMSQVKDGELEMAITQCNLADLAAARQGIEAAEKEIEDCLEKAWTLINSENLERDAYYAFVCEKCAPSFSYYGYFMYANTLEKRAKGIYEGA